MKIGDIVECIVDMHWAFHPTLARTLKEGDRLKVSTVNSIQFSYEIGTNESEYLSIDRVRVVETETVPVVTNNEVKMQIEDVVFPYSTKTEFRAAVDAIDTTEFDYRIRVATANNLARQRSVLRFQKKCHVAQALKFVPFDTEIEIIHLLSGKTGCVCKNLDEKQAYDWFWDEIRELTSYTWNLTTAEYTVPQKSPSGETQASAEQVFRRGTLSTVLSPIPTDVLDRIKMLRSAKIFNATYAFAPRAMWTHTVREIPDPGVMVVGAVHEFLPVLSDTPKVGASCFFPVAHWK